MQLQQISILHNIKHVMILALMLRVIWALLVPVEPISDSFLYDAFANSIAAGNGYAFPDGKLTVFWPVGTSAIYALLFKAFGTSHLSIVIFNIAIGLAIVWLSYALTKRYLNQKVAVLAALFVAIWPVFIQFTTILASELIFIFLVLLALYLWGNKDLKPVVKAVILGALICGATYIRPTALPLIVLLPILDWFAHRNIKTSLTSLIAATITAAILFAPWAYRNYQVFGEFVLVSANGGVNLWMGNHEGATGAYTPIPELGFKNEVERDQHYKQEAVRYISQNPLKYVQLAFKRAEITYKAENIGIVWNGALHRMLDKSNIFALKLLSTAFWWLMLGLAAIGIFLLLRKKALSPFHILFVVFAFFFVVPFLTVGQDRYHMPINPFLAIFAAYASCYLFKTNTTKDIGAN